MQSTTAQGKGGKDFEDMQDVKDFKGLEGFGAPGRGVQGGRVRKGPGFEDFGVHKADVGVGVRSQAMQEPQDFKRSGSWPNRKLLPLPTTPEFLGRLAKATLDGGRLLVCACTLKRRLSDGVARAPPFGSGIYTQISHSRSRSAGR